ncbi:MAG: tRNA (adenosine(37)-N6)-threonylcarbamoyltransferase complex dimerization subunit type 1 TsaB [Planctomycetales bacterium]
MLTLAIETSCSVGGLALFENDACLAERRLHLGQQHGQSLLPEISRLLNDFSRSPKDCQLLAVSVGPGSFTGLRVGVVCAKTLAYATGCRIVAVDTHQAIAENAPAEMSHVHVVSEAQRGDVLVSRYRRKLGHFEIESPLEFLPGDAWLAGLGAGDVATGPGLAKLVQTAQTGPVRLGGELWLPQGSVVGRLGIALARGERFSDPWALEPLYLRRSSAEEKWELRRRNTLPEGDQHS